MLLWIREDIRFAAWSFWVNRLAASVSTPRPLRYFVYRFSKMDIHTPSIAPGSFFTGPRVKIGKGSFINFRCFFDSRMADVEIGNECEVGMEVMFCAATHKIGPSSHRCGTVTGLPVKIGDGCWIGARAVILPGVTIASGCIIGAGAVVTSDCEPNGLYAGVPAKRLRDLP